MATVDAPEPHGAPDATHASTEAAHGGEGGGGLPQFEFEYWGGQIVWLLLIFAVLYLLLGKVFVPRLRRVIDQRAQTIADAVEQARKVQTETEVQAAAAQAELAEARARAVRTGAEAKARIAEDVAKRQAAEEARLNERMAEAEARIRAMRDAAMANVGTIAADTAKAMAEKLTGAPAPAGDIEAAVARLGAKGAA
ncbi:MAG TPA: hypothetical protein VEA15_10250 [Caulobacteraceae bacterium]|nr:hypothetical protein [Caulobacteraceae bacterium]